MNLKARSVRRSITPQERRRSAELADKVDREEMDEIKAMGRRFKAEGDRLRSVFRELQAERKRQKLSLASVAQRSGIDKSRLSKLENSDYPNVTLDTIERYADALGKQVLISVADKV
jgi:DNA-binding Xre family transcriptional regulator